MQKLSASNATIRSLEERLESKERELTEVLQKSRDDISERDSLISSLRERVQTKTMQAEIIESYWKEECIKVTARCQAEKVILLASAQLREDTLHSQKMEKTEHDNEGKQEENQQENEGKQEENQQENEEKQDEKQQENEDKKQKKERKKREKEEKKQRAKEEKMEKKKKEKELKMAQKQKENKEKKTGFWSWISRKRKSDSDSKVEEAAEQQAEPLLLSTLPPSLHPSSSPPSFSPPSVLLSSSSFTPNHSPLTVLPFLPLRQPLSSPPPSLLSPSTAPPSPRPSPLSPLHPSQPPSFPLQGGTRAQWSALQPHRNTSTCLFLLVSVWSLHVLLVSAWVFSRHSGFLPQHKDMQVRLIGNY